MIISQMIGQFVQDELKKRYPAFGIWLYGSELAVVVGLLFVLPGEVSVWAILYGILTIFLFRGYLRKYVAKPVPPGLVVTLGSYIFLAGFVIGVALILIFAPVLNGNEEPEVVTINGIRIDATGAHPYGEEGAALDGTVDDAAANGSNGAGAELEQQANQAAEESDATDETDAALNGL